MVVLWKESSGNARLSSDRPIPDETMPQIIVFDDPDMPLVPPRPPDRPPDPPDQPGNDHDTTMDDHMHPPDEPRARSDDHPKPDHPKPDTDTSMDDHMRPTEGPDREQRPSMPSPPPKRSKGTLRPHDVPIIDDDDDLLEDKEPPKPKEPQGIPRPPKTKNTSEPSTTAKRAKNEEQPSRSSTDEPVPTPEVQEQEPQLPMRDPDDESGGAETDDTELYSEDLLIAVDSTSWQVSSEGHKLAATTSSFSFIVDHNGKDIDVATLPTHPEVHSRYSDHSAFVTKESTSLCHEPESLASGTMSWNEQRGLDQCYRLIQQTKPKKLKTRKEATTADVRKYYKEFMTAKKA